MELILNTIKNKKEIKEEDLILQLSDNSILILSGIDRLNSQFKNIPINNLFNYKEIPLNLNTTLIISENCKKLKKEDIKNKAFLKLEIINNNDLPYYIDFLDKVLINGEIPHLSISKMKTFTKEYYISYDKDIEIRIKNHTKNLIVKKVCNCLTLQNTNKRGLIMEIIVSQIDNSYQPNENDLIISEINNKISVIISGIKETQFKKEGNRYIFNSPQLEILFKDGRFLKYDILKNTLKNYQEFKPNIKIDLIKNEHQINIKPKINNYHLLTMPHEAVLHLSDLLTLTIFGPFEIEDK